MEMKDRQGHRPIPVTMKDLNGQNWCPCCKNGIIARNEGAPMAACTWCGQRYQIMDKGEENGEVKTEAAKG